MGEDTQLKAGGKDFEFPYGAWHFRVWTVAGGKERREAARLQNAAYGVQGAYGEERQAVSRVRQDNRIKSYYQ